MALEEEQCVPWEPVPDAANRYMVLHVAFFEQFALGGPKGGPVSIVVGASSQDGPSSSRSVLAWRITFRDVAAYQMIHIGTSPGRQPYEFAADGEK